MIRNGVPSGARSTTLPRLKIHFTSPSLVIMRYSLMIWGDLPASVQHELFESAVRLSGAGTREQLAVFLHHRHPRTANGDKPARAVPEPDSLGG